VWRGLPGPGSLAGFAPLSIAVVALTRIRNRFCAVRCVPGLSQHTAQVDGHLLVDVFAPGFLEYFCLGSQGHRELAVVLVGYGSEVLEHGEDLAPLDIPAGRVLEDFHDRVAMVTAQVRGY